jgi:hypothetical protein
MTTESTVAKMGRSMKKWEIMTSFHQPRQSSGRWRRGVGGQDTLRTVHNTNRQERQGFHMTFFLASLAVYWFC